MGKFPCSQRGFEERVSRDLEREEKGKYLKGSAVQGLEKQGTECGEQNPDGRAWKRWILSFVLGFESQNDLNCIFI